MIAGVLRVCGFAGRVGIVGIVGRIRRVGLVEQLLGREVSLSAGTNGEFMEVGYRCSAR